jgi:hypothetical protein
VDFTYRETPVSVPPTGTSADVLATKPVGAGVQTFTAQVIATTPSSASGLECRLEHATSGAFVAVGKATGLAVNLTMYGVAYPSEGSTYVLRCSKLPGTSGTVQIENARVGVQSVRQIRVSDGG